MVMEYKEPTRLDSESLPSDEDDLQGAISSPTCQSQSHDGSLGPPHLNKSKEIMGDLELGMECSSKESAYDYYYNYARDKGFDVMTHHWKKKIASIVTRVTHTRSRQGFRRNDEPVEDHNHALVQTPMKHMLKINRKMS
ncbi:uncharacterized protein LOC125472637 [Pyrus x bretschneideri]|uniref:uncharacterized protein LOC125472637 n=1 Tax=Pyrus x bretschneideri TaxID=225117 RepID=UPI002030AA1B|nr:uncharacterized protein LOC125472637 [Pyrus x bretschneideri]